MDDAQLLRELGWSDELIEEAGCLSAEVRNTDQATSDIHDQTGYSNPMESDSLFFDEPVSDTDTNIPAADCKRR